MGHRRALHALALNVFLRVCMASPSVPVATDPILSTVTVSTVIPSLVTVYSIVPATDATPDSLTTITTIADGQTTTIISTGVIAGSITSTIISTVSLTTTQVTVSTIGYSTILGPDPTTATTESSVPTTTPASTSDTPTLTSTSALDTSSTSSAVGETNVLVTSSGTSTTSASTASLPSSTSSTTSISPSATGTNASTQASHSSSTSKGLSTGAKAGIGVGVALGVILLVLLSFLLGQRYSRRRNEHARDNTDLKAANEKDIFQAGRPYEATGPRYDALGPSAAKGHAYSTTTAIGSGSESTSGRSYDVPISDSAQNHANNPELSALPPIAKGDEPMYVGVPAHMSGSKRWSMKEFMK
ncbi:uncharacterized protein Z520_01687 [Fonsecaea multimorphosa CBS 102226]|uniref:Mid2 domain-containing protein n=1 Tax=Fonsecaea multimorphosa CBS 102226 TaxID=1442371 RepID=A0A0D2KIB2_9EURO|nr:uncharacterized protein Z520_01687 [Fonsecaea multimorphosa CBS 102226]KIY03220.1 hypothetical protein Z520_01687 [Fonsecaea multimorphosa CBS 102226]OAL30459.1 hypothetical protein AYO22_01657 [Fonsecaea multimorphosa]